MSTFEDVALKYLISRTMKIKLVTRINKTLPPPDLKATETYSSQETRAKMDPHLHSPSFNIYWAELRKQFKQSSKIACCYQIHNQQ